MAGTKIRQFKPTSQKMKDLEEVFKLMEQKGISLTFFGGRTLIEFKDINGMWDLHDLEDRGTSVEVLPPTFEYRVSLEVME